MAKKKGGQGKKRTGRVRRLKKATPPPDDPWLRHQAEELAQGSGDAQKRALARARAFEQSRKMPTADDSSQTSSEDES